MHILPPYKQYFPLLPFTKTTSILMPKLLDLPLVSAKVIQNIVNSRHITSNPLIVCQKYCANRDSEDVSRSKWDKHQHGLVRPSHKDKQKCQIKYNKIFLNCSWKCEVGNTIQVPRAEVERIWYSETTIAKGKLTS